MFRRAVNNEQGHTFLYVAVIFPILSTLSILAFDISNWQAARSSLQAQADRISLLAARALPDTSRAETIIAGEIDSLPLVAISSHDDLAVTESEIRLSLTSEVNSLFDLALRAAGFDSVVFTAKQSSSVQVLPQDTIIILSDSASLRPPYYTAWGSQLEWPASDYFYQSNPPEVLGEAEAAPDYTEEDWNNSDFQRWATQNCFNPVFSPLKLAALSLTDIVLESTRNRASVFFTPGSLSGQSFSTTLPLRYQHLQGEIMSGRWDETVPETWFGDETCIYISDASQSGTGAYAYHETALNFRNIDPSCLRRLATTDYSFHFPTGKLSQCFERSAALTERIYFRASRDKSHDTSGEALLDTINAALAEIARASSTVSNQNRSIRENAAAISRKHIIAFVDTVVPVDSRLTDLITSLHQVNSKLSLVFYSHPGLQTNKDHLTGDTLELGGSATIADILETRFNKLSEAASEEKILDAFYLTEGEALIEQAVPFLLETTRETSLKK